MKTCVQQSFDPYQRETVLSPVVRELPWNNQVIARDPAQNIASYLRKSAQSVDSKNSDPQITQISADFHSGAVLSPLVGELSWTHNFGQVIKHSFHLRRSAKSADKKIGNPQITKIIREVGDD